MTTSDESWPNSGTTGALQLATALGNSTGLQRLEIGFARPLPVSVGLAELSPRETDRRLVAALERISGQPVRFDERTMIPREGPIYSVVTGIRWDIRTDDAGRALDIIEGSFRAAPEEKIAAEVYRLRTLTRGRDQRSEADQEAEAMIWVEGLRCYPGDVVVDVLRSWPGRPNGEWWPTWSEVMAELQKRVTARRALADFVQRILDRKNAPAAIEDHSGEVSDERRAQLSEMMIGVAATMREPVVADVEKNLPPEARKKLAEARLGELERQFRAAPVGLSPSTLRKLESEGHIDPAHKAA